MAIIRVKDSTIKTDGWEKAANILLYPQTVAFGRRFEIINDAYTELKRPQIGKVAMVALKIFSSVIYPFFLILGVILQSISKSYHQKVLHLEQLIENELNERLDAVKITGENQSLSAKVLFPEQKAEKGAYFWKGLIHKWKRKVFLKFDVPHRISRIQSSIIDENHQHSDSNARVKIGQRTGVDGNHMEPELHYSCIKSDDLETLRGTVKLEWQDDSVEGVYPRAATEIEYPVSVPITDMKLKDQVTAVLRGIRLRTKSLEGKDDGMWPYKFYVGIKNCKKEPGENRVNFTVKISIRRAWTPHLGGIKHLVEKPYQKKLKFELDVDFTLLTGKKGCVNFTTGESITSEGKGRKRNPIRGNKQLKGAPGIYDVGMSALQGFGFKLSRYRDHSLKDMHMGRYIQALNFSIRDKENGYNKDTGELEIEYQNQVKVPISVVNTKVNYILDPVLIQTKSGNVQHGVHKTKFCVNSDGAPLFSRKRYSKSRKRGPVCTEVEEEIKG